MGVRVCNPTASQIRTPIVMRCLRHLVTLPPLRGPKLTQRYFPLRHASQSTSSRATTAKSSGSNFALNRIRF